MTYVVPDNYASHNMEGGRAVRYRPGQVFSCGPEVENLKAELENHSKYVLGIFGNGKPFAPFYPGLRCETLILLGLIWILLGAGVIMGVPEARGGLAFELIPGDIRGGVWIGTGLFAIMSGLRSKWTNVALGLLNIMPILRLSSYLIAWFDSFVDANLPGSAFNDGWYFASMYLVQVCYILFAARIPAGTLRTLGTKHKERQ